RHQRVVRGEQRGIVDRGWQRYPYLDFASREHAAILTPTSDYKHFWIDFPESLSPIGDPMISPYTRKFRRGGGCALFATRSVRGEKMNGENTVALSSFLEQVVAAVRAMTGCSDVALADVDYASPLPVVSGDMGARVIVEENTFRVERRGTVHVSG